MGLKTQHGPEQFDAHMDLIWTWEEQSEITHLKGSCIHSPESSCSCLHENQCLLLFRMEVLKVSCHKWFNTTPWNIFEYFRAMEIFALQAMDFQGVHMFLKIMIILFHGSEILLQRHVSSWKCKNKFANN